MNHTPHGWRSRPNPNLYSPTNLNRYGKLVVNYSHRWAWKIDNSFVARLYADHVGPRHLEVGPGDGHFLAQTAPPTPAPPQNWRVSLLDINTACLDKTAARLHGRAQVGALEHDLLVPWPLADASQDSVACGNVLHCVPGAGFGAKQDVLAEMARCLTDDGTAWGYTLLASRDRMIRPNWLARALMWSYNRRENTFFNRGDFYADLERILGMYFRRVEVGVTGCAAYWVVRGPVR